MAQYETPEERMSRKGRRTVGEHVRDFFMGEDEPKTKDDLERERNRKDAERRKQEIERDREEKERRKRSGEASILLGRRG